jgi:aromatic ring-opening dioxygenase catalytic subunit (LigB family)
MYNAFAFMIFDHTKMPVLYVGHGSPMNTIEDNDYIYNSIELLKELPTSKIILLDNIISNSSNLPILNTQVAQL